MDGPRVPNRIMIERGIYAHKSDNKETNSKFEFGYDHAKSRIVAC